nr:MAG TPA: hypothetical protein [Inoviridae sp.]
MCRHKNVTSIYSNFPFSMISTNSNYFVRNIQ